jgi:hypothetical protein
MRRIFAFAVIAAFCLAAILLHSEIKDFLFSHPWWQSCLAAMPEIAAPILALLELRHTGEANELRTEANNHRARANTLQEEHGRSIAHIAKLQEQVAGLTRELDTQRNTHLQQIAANTQRPKSEAEANAEILKKYIRQRAFVTEGGNNWGAMGAVVAEVNANHTATLFVPAGYNSSQAWGQPVRCDKLHIVEVPTDSCALQVSVIERYGAVTTYGEARSWEERSIKLTHAGMKRGENVFSAQYRKNGSPTLRNIYVYASTDGSPNYTMVRTEGQQETEFSYSSKLDTEKKFAIVQLEWVDQGYHWVSGSSGGANLNLFVRK